MRAAVVHDFSKHALTEDPVQAIRELGGADAAISVAVAPKAFEQAFGSLRRGGRLVFVALPAENTVPVPIFETVLNGITIIGLFRLHAAGRTRVVRETRRLDEVNESTSASNR